MPDYDGRGNPDTDAESWALWIPRIALAPLYLASEYVLRRPLGALVRSAERGRWSDSLAQLFRFGEGGKSLIVPIAWFDLGVSPSLGLYYVTDDLVADGNALSLQATTWGLRSIHVAAADQYAIDPADRVQVQLEARRSEDDLFLGIGPDATSATRSRYAAERIRGGVGYHRRLTDHASLDAAAGLHRIRFLDGACCGDPSLDARIARGEVMAPPGYRDAYTAADADLELTLDTRGPRPGPGDGVYLHLRTAPGMELRGGRSWIEYGGVAGAALDLTGHRRTLRAQLALDLVDAMSGEVPFSEDPVLGGELMPGFVPGWMTGPSTAAAQLGYSWPIWLGLDAQTRVTVGNAFGDHLAGLAPGKLRLSGDIGLTTDTERERGFTLLLGVGTETFEQGADLTSVRITFGTRWASP